MPVIDELQEDIKALKRYHQYERAMAFCRSERCGYKRGHRCMEAEGCDLITEKGLKGRLSGVVKNGYEYADGKILCTVEEINLAKWIRGEGDANRPPSREEVRGKVVEILEVRLQTRYGGR